MRFRRADRSDPSGRAARPGAGPFLLAAVLMAAALGAGAVGCSSGGRSPGTASARARTAGPRALEGGPVAFIDRTPDGLRREHEGRIDGFLSYNAIYPASGEHVIVLANSEATPVQAIAATLARLTLRAPL